MEKVVRVFHSWEEADAANRREWLSMTPEERVQIFLSLQQRGFEDASQQRLERVYRVLELEQS
ncbi:MAG: hypothetical protein JNL98_12385 [Bryobacterales bacterium]|nr:hypothetical protein [Bryobacterales bacterium]